MIQVAVIGAGAAGLCIGRYLAAQPDVFTAVIYEQSSSVGGTWAYNEKTGLDDNGVTIPCKVYCNLRTNLPKQVMGFPDFPFPDEVSSYMTHAQVQKHLEDYADHFTVRNLIQFNTQVVKVTPKLQENTKEKWEVTVKDVRSKKETTSIFDAVVCCIGKVPKIPPLPGIEQFPGLVLHSRGFRHPEDYKDKRVLLLGARSSGVDICIDLRNSAHAVYLSHHHDRITHKLPDNVEQHLDVKAVFDDGTIHFQDGRTRQADVIIFCTGYDLSFPFFTNECGVTVKNNRITHLYKHIFNIKYPSLSFIGFGIEGCFFPQYSLQARLLVAFLSEKVMLKIEEEMLLDEETEFQDKISSKGMQIRNAHFQRPKHKQWEYNEEIAKLAKCEPVPPIVKKLYYHHWNFKNKDLLGYKKREYKATSDSTWDDIL